MHQEYWKVCENCFSNYILVPAMLVCSSIEYAMNLVSCKQSLEVVLGFLFIVFVLFLSVLVYFICCEFGITRFQNHLVIISILNGHIETHNRPKLGFPIV